MDLLSKLRNDFPGIVFREGEDFHWSPKTQEVIYKPVVLDTSKGNWTLLHELGHARLKHDTYELDLTLLQMEAAAWQDAKELAVNYDITIAEDHIQNCLDSYRDWLHLRSACPRCNTHSFQEDSRHYRCINCGQVWTVTASRFCRPYRRIKSKDYSQHTKALFN